MKKLILILGLILVSGTVYHASAQEDWRQDPNWGTNPDQREENVLLYNFFKGSYDMEMYGDAADYLRQVITNVPHATENIYIHGINMYRELATAEKDPARKVELVDSLITLYDYRLEYFGDDPQGAGRAFVLKNKAADFRALRPAERERIVHYLKDAVDMGGEDLEGNTVADYFNELTQEFKMDNISIDYYLSEFDRLRVILREKDEVDSQRMIEGLFAQSGAADSENIERIYRPRVEADPTNTDLLASVIAMLERSRSTGEFYLYVAELFYKQQPSANTAVIIAKYYQDKKEHATALRYLNEALAIESNPAAKSNLAISIASSQLQAGNSREAANFARKTMDSDPNSGYAYFILAQAYALGANSCTGFERQSVYWLVVDNLTIARRLLAADPTSQIPIREVDGMINGYQANFPSLEEMFFRSIDEGTSYNVNCGWISGRAIARKRP